MKRILLFLLVFFIIRFGFAAEGMWIPSLLEKLNKEDLKNAGLQIDIDKIWSTQKPSIKDAIVNFGGGCTAEVISYEGLILTNHHCGYAQIQAHSSLEHDYLRDGFWAMNRSQELPNPGLTASLVVDMIDVTQRVFENATDESGRANPQTVQRNIEKIKAEAEQKGYEAQIKAFNYGNGYFLILSEKFLDVRLVGAPPSSIGKFGGDTDNWIWPRHTGDFSIFRIYAGKDNRPAEYSPENVPYKPKYSLPISVSGVHADDFTMVFGFPGRTQQFLSSAAVDFLVNESNPARIKMRETALSIIDADMRSSDLIRIQYSAKQARISNAYKKWIGETAGLKRLNAVSKKRELENEYTERASKDPDFQKRFASLPKDFETLYASFKPYALAYDYFSELIFSGPEFIRYANGFEKITEDYTSLDRDKKVKETVERHQSALTGYFKNYNPETDKKLFLALFPMYLEGTPAHLLPEEIAVLKKKYKGNWTTLANDIFAKSYFTDRGRMENLLKNFGSSSVKKIKADPAYALMKVLYNGYRTKIESEFKKGYGQAEYMMSEYVAGMMRLFPEKKFWYDANSTLRLSYGKVEGSRPRDGMMYDYYTTVDGMMEKYIPGNEEFDLPSKLIELWKKKDYGSYAGVNGMPVAFTASNQTTGGNSGSPVLNANGHLIGINFDRSWESTMSDVMYDPVICRNIILDIRYVLFIIDKYAGAGHLLREMELMTPEKSEELRKENVRNEILTVTESIRAKADDASLLLKRADLYQSIGMHKEAETDLRLAVKINPRSAVQLHLLGHALMDQSRFAEAAREFEKALAVDPGFHEALLDKGICLSELKKFEEAIKVYTLYISKNSLDHRGYYNRGVCYYLINKKIEGCADFMIAEKLGGTRESWLRKELCN